MTIDLAPDTGTNLALPALPTDLPPVERRATVPHGFAASGVACGIKASGRPDLALIVASGRPGTDPAAHGADGTEGADGAGRPPLAVAAVFTQNRFAAAPVRQSRAVLAAAAPEGEGRYGWASAVICTTGSANAATGPEGERDQVAVGRLTAGALGIDESAVLHLSTGIIGTRLPLDRVEAGLADAVDALRESEDGLEDAARAFRTTDSTTKLATTTVMLPGEAGADVEVRVTGIAKGVGMIHPQMATMLSVVSTDATAEPAVLSRILRDVTTRTWNQLSVDGDTSTNDTVFLMASGAAGAAPVVDGEALAGLTRAVEAVARDLARQQAADGEGATALITCQVSGAADDADARAVARAVVASSLVKAAVHGRDPNWGRIAGAAGNAAVPASASPATVDPARLRIAIAGHLVYDGGSGGPVPFDKAAAREAMGGAEVLIRLDLGLGAGSGEAFGCDLTEAYVRENSEYTT